jgi:hypothetical protein
MANFAQLVGTAGGSGKINWKEQVVRGSDLLVTLQQKLGWWCSRSSDTVVLIPV